jgi:MFS transporter, AAHS family, benzoate transport protein
MRTVDVSLVINESKFSKYHIILVFWCSVLVFFDGIELGLIGAISTSLMEEWSLNSVQLGAISSYTAIGMILGGLLFGPLGDRVSRKNIILISSFIYSLFTLMGAFSQGIVDFSIYRFIAGIGMGGVVPTTLGLITDIFPRKNRSFSLTIATASIGLGAMVAGLLAIFLLPVFGWRSLFIVGALPIIALPFLVKILPESPIILFNKQKFAELANSLNRIKNEKTYTADDKYQIEVTTKSKVPFTALFQNKQTIGTLLIWLTCLCSYLVSFALTAWLPNLMVRAGYPLTSGLLFTVVLGLGALIGSLTGGKLSERIGLKKIVVISYILGGLSLCVLSINIGSSILLYSIFFITGLGTTGSQNLLLAYCSQFYPTEIRSTGIATANIMGRVGSFIGPIFGGIIISLNFSTPASFVAFGIVVLLAALSLSGIRAAKESSNNHLTINNTIKLN